MPVHHFLYGSENLWGQPCCIEEQINRVCSFRQAELDRLRLHDPEVQEQNEQNEKKTLEWVEQCMHTLLMCVFDTRAIT